LLVFELVSDIVISSNLACNPTAQLGIHASIDHPLVPKLHLLDLSFLKPMKMVLILDCSQYRAIFGNPEQSQSAINSLAQPIETVQTEHQIL